MIRYHTSCYQKLTFPTYVILIQVAELHYNFGCPLAELKESSKKRTIKAVVTFNTRLRDDPSFANEVNVVWPVSIEDWEAHAPRPPASDDEDNTPLRRRRLSHTSRR